MHDVWEMFWTRIHRGAHRRIAHPKIDIGVEQQNVILEAQATIPPSHKPAMSRDGSGVDVDGTPNKANSAQVSQEIEQSESSNDEREQTVTQDYELRLLSRNNTEFC